MAETLDMALLFLEERGGIVYGESPPETRRGFDQTVWDLGQALDKEFPPFRAAEAQAVSRFMGFFSMAPVMTPWASAHEREPTHEVALSDVDRSDPAQRIPRVVDVRRQRPGRGARGVDPARYVRRARRGGRRHSDRRGGPGGWRQSYLRPGLERDGKLLGRKCVWRPRRRDNDR
mgnify:CR=1 FL=1